MSGQQQLETFAKRSTSRCSIRSKPEPGKQVEVVGAATSAAGQRSNEASFGLWRAFAEPANFVVAPHSIRSSLALLYLASLPGEGRSSLQSKLQYPERNEDVDIRLLDGAVRATQEARFVSANAVWVARQPAVRTAYLDGVSRPLRAEVHAIDFAANPERAQQTINTWVSDRTRGKIPKILEGRAVTEATRAALVNAVYFFGKWHSPFDPKLTGPGPFRSSQGATIQATMMMGSRCSAVFGDDYQAAYADYGGNTSMVFVVVVPKQWQEFPWDAATFRRVWHALEGASETELVLPKFSVRSRRPLSSVLHQLGIDLSDPPRRC